MGFLRDAGHGYDEFGATDAALERVRPVLEFLHDVYFRVTAHDVHHVPEAGGVVVVSNHSGTLPFDGAMIAANILFERERLIRPVADRFLPNLPFFGTWLTRIGAVTGSRGNVRYLLERGEGILIFPEGTQGIGKAFSQRYQLQAWRVGHAELAIQNGVPVVPVAVIGAEEQMPQLARITAGAKWVGAPYFPVTLTPLPLPVRYHLHYGEPIDLSAYDADDSRSLADAAALVRSRVEGLIADGLRRRRGTFV